MKRSGGAGPRRRAADVLAVSFFASFGALLGSPAPARASVCCGDASGLGDRLDEHEIAAFTGSLSGRGRFGSFDEEGTFYSSDARDVDLRLQLDASARLGEWLEAGASLPLVLNLRGADDAIDFGGGLGDISARVRATIAPSSWHRYAPGLSATVGVVVPTGVPASASTSASLADVTGQGAGEVVLGLTTDKVFEGVMLARVDGSVGLFVPSFVDAERSQRAPRLTVSGLVGPVLPGVALAVGAGYEVEGPPSTAPRGEVARARVDLLASVAVDLSTTLALLASSRTSIPATGAGTNEVASVSTSAGLRVAVHGL